MGANESKIINIDGVEYTVSNKLSTSQALSYTKDTVTGELVYLGSDFTIQGQSDVAHNIIIFPQGTRVPPQSTIKDYPYKPGFIALIKSIGADIVPMALNSGNLWKKKQFLKPSGTITMKFMDPIKYEDIKDLSKEEIIAKIEKIIEPESQKLNKDFE